MKKMNKWLKLTITTLITSLTAIPLISIPISCSAPPYSQDYLDELEFNRIRSLEAIWPTDYNLYIPDNKLFRSDNNNKVNEYHWINESITTDNTIGMLYCLAYQKSTDEVVACLVAPSKKYDQQIAIDKLKIPDYVYLRDVYSINKDGSKNNGKFKLKFLGLPPDRDENGHNLSKWEAHRDIGKYIPVKSSELISIDWSKFSFEYVYLFFGELPILDGAYANFKIKTPKTLKGAYSMDIPYNPKKSSWINSVEFDFSLSDIVFFNDEIIPRSFTKLILPKNIQKLDLNGIPNNIDADGKEIKIEIIGLENVLVFNEDALKLSTTIEEIHLADNVWYCASENSPSFPNIKVYGGKTYTC